MASALTQFVLGKTAGKSLSEQKRAVLTAAYLGLWATIAIYYVVTNLITARNTFLSPYYIYLGVLVVCFWLNRNGYNSWAKMIMLIVGNFLIFIYSSRKPLIPGPFLFFPVCILMSLSVFGWEERKKAFGLVALSIALIFTARYGNFFIAPRIHISEDYITQNFFNNLMVSCVVSVIVIYFMMSVNYRAENSLRAQEVKLQEKNKELLKTNEELDRFIYSTSHDLRAPLSSILGLINLCELTPDTSEIKVYHQMMRERLGKLDVVLQEILDYSKNSKSEISLQSINVKNLVLKAISDVQFAMGASQIKIDLKIDDNLEVISDSSRLSIILNNLVSNAIKYSDPNKATQLLSIEAEKQKEGVVIRVEDNGEGIDEIHHDKIFTMFYRASSQSRGSGLGLYLVKEAVEKLKGTLEVKSKRGVGSTFIVTLPQ